MKLLADHDVYAATIQILVGLGHDVVRAVDIGLASAPDEDLLAWASQNQRVLITRDRDFGNLVFVGNVSEASNAVAWIRQRRIQDDKFFRSTSTSGGSWPFTRSIRSISASSAT